jgi:hypothetical protein
MRFRFDNAHAPSADRLGPTDVAQLRRIIGLVQGMPDYDGPIPSQFLDSIARYDVIAEGVHRYDAWIMHGWLPVVVFDAGRAEVRAWWSDQDDATEGFADADDVYAAYEALVAKA